MPSLSSFREEDDIDQQRASLRPASGTKTGRVWEVADELRTSLGRLPRLSEVTKADAAEGGHPGTGQVQYHSWRNAQPVGTASRGGDAPARRAPPDPATQPGRTPGSGAWLSIAPDGRIDVPADLIEALALDGSMKVGAEVVDGGLRPVPRPLGLERVQAMVRALDRGTGSVVDELLAERRAEAARDAGE